MQFVNGMNTSYVQIRNELASEQVIEVQFQVAMSGRYSANTKRQSKRLKKKCPKKISRHKRLNLSIRFRTAQKGQLKHRPLYLVFT